MHTPVEKKITNPVKIEKQIKTISDTCICAIDLNMNEHLAVCTIRDVEGSTLATLFIGGGQRVSGFRKRILGRIARNRKRTGIIARCEQDNADLWQKIRNVDDSLRSQSSQIYDPTARGSDYVGVSGAAGWLALAECHVL